RDTSAALRPYRKGIRGQPKRKNTVSMSVFCILMSLIDSTWGDMVRQPRYRSGDASSILGVSRDHLRYLEDRIESSGTTGWRNRSLLDLFRLLLAMELSQHGVDAVHAVRLAHEIRLGHEDSRWAGAASVESTSAASLEEQLTGELFGQTMLAYRDGDNW